MLLLDTSVVIELRNGTPFVLDRLRKPVRSTFLSAITLMELEGGVYSRPELADLRRARLEAVLSTIPVIAFDEPCARAYGQIVAASGFSRRKAIDRMISATALVHGFHLATLNAGDFADVPGLFVEDWGVA